MTVHLNIKRWVFNLVIVLFCVFIGSVIGFYIYEGKLWNRVQEVTAQKEQEAVTLQEEKRLLEQELSALTEKLEVLSDTLSQKAEEAQELQEALDAFYLPIGFPLTGSATFSYQEDSFNCIFSGTENIMVVATACGTVISVEPDETYGHKVVIDHGNGYTTMYGNKGDVRVKIGDVVARGTTLFLIGKDNAELGYQMTKDGSAINPMDLLEISG